MKKKRNNKLFAVGGALIALTPITSCVWSDDACSMYIVPDLPSNTTMNMGEDLTRTTMMNVVSASSYVSSVTTTTRPPTV